MVDQKTTELTEDAAPALTDLGYTVEDPAGTPTSKKVTWSNILALYDSKSATLTNKTIDADNNTISNIALGAEATGASTDLTDTANLAYLDTANTFAQSQTILGDAADRSLNISRYGVSLIDGPKAIFNGANGTVASPTAVTIAESVGQLEFNGWDGTSAFRPMATMIVSALETISPTQHGGRITFNVTATGDTSTTEVLTLDPNQISYNQINVVGFVYDEDGFQNAITNLANASIKAGAGIASSKLATVEIAQGGSGETTAQAAIDALSAVSAATNEHVLTKDTGTGNAIWKVASSGFTDPMTTRGDIIFKNSGGTTTRLAAGANTFVLTSDGTDISWAASAGGGDTVVGTQVIEIDSSALYPGGDTPAAGIVTKQFGAQSQPIRAIQMSDGADQEVYWQGKLNNWDAGTIKVKAYWFVENDLATPESKTFELDCSGVSLANFENIGGTAYGTLQTITDTTDSSAGAEDKINISPASASITIAGTPAAGEWLSIKMVRDATSDTAGNVFLAGISIEYTIATGTATI